LTVLLRRVNRIPRSTQDGGLGVERSAYAIMCELAHDGPQRLGSIAAAIGLDLSTITSQVRGLERLVWRSARRPRPIGAAILSLTSVGRDVLERTSKHRRDRLDKALADWPDRDLAVLAHLLTDLNVSLNRLDGPLLIAGGVPELVV
jgi:DNA-binding MarR family transcriptional regulator